MNVWDEEVECDASEVTLTCVLTDGTQMKVPVEQCPFVGEAQVRYAGGELQWTCPACGSENVTETDVDGDPDLARKAELERDL